MPNSQFVTHLIAFKNRIAQKKLEQVVERKGIKICSDLTKAGNMSRIFDALPRELMDEKLISQLEKNYLALYKFDHFPAAQTGLLRDFVMLQACDDLLDENGDLNPELVTAMGLKRSIDIHGKEQTRQAILSSYIGYVSELFTRKIDPTDEEKMRKDNVFVKDLEGPAPRNFLISRAFNEDRSQRVTDLAHKTVIARLLNKISANTFMFSRNALYNYSEKLASHIVSEMKTASLVRKNQAMQFWVDVMYICQEIGDFNSFHAIHYGLKTAGVEQKNIPDETIRAKFYLCDQLGNPAYNFENVLNQTRRRMDEKLNTIPLYRHIKRKPFSQGVLRKYDWKSSVDNVFSKNETYQKYIVHLTTQASQAIERKHHEMQLELKTLITELPKLQAEKKDSPKSDASLLTQVFSLFKSDPYTSAREALENIYCSLQEDETKTGNLHLLADQALVALAKLPAADDKKSESAAAMLKLTAIAREIKADCVFLKKHGEENIPALVRQQHNTNNRFLLN